MTQAKRKFKILLVGDSAVGKTALLERFTHGTYSTHGITLHFDVEIKTMQIGSREVRLAIWPPDELTVTSHLPLIRLGNKTDLLESESPLRSGAERLAEEFRAFKHVNASAKSGEGVNPIFEDLVFEILFNAYARDDSHGPSVQPDNEEEEEKSSSGGCC
ncbi:Ras- protein Rab-30 [Tulasnella sp. 417]|nr:Ras- protein Rab-30 [Tulasnella sp. 417]